MVPGFSIEALALPDILAGGQYTERLSMGYSGSVVFHDDYHGTMLDADSYGYYADVVNHEYVYHYFKWRRMVECLKSAYSDLSAKVKITGPAWGTLCQYQNLYSSTTPPRIADDYYHPGEVGSEAENFIPFDFSFHILKKGEELTFWPTGSYTGTAIWAVAAFYFCRTPESMLSFSQWPVLTSNSYVRTDSGAVKTTQ